jgi:hypothetical protein
MSAAIDVKQICNQADSSARSPTLYPRTQDIDDGVLQITSYMVPVIDIN